MGMLRNYCKKRATVRAHASALKASAKTEAKLAAKEARSRAREAHLLDMAEIKERAKQAKRTAAEQAKRAKKSAAKQAKQARKSAIKQSKRVDSAARREAAGAKSIARRAASARQKERKHNAKLESAGRKHEYKMAELELKKVDASKFGEKDVKRLLGAAKAATPILIPLVYKVLSSAPAPSLGGSSAEAAEAGIKATGPGAALGGRIVRLEQTLDQLESSRNNTSTKDFASATRARLKDLRTSVEAAEALPTTQRREVHSAISGEIDRISRDVLARLGVKA